jgi:hypothetical protein
MPRAVSRPEEGLRRPGGGSSRSLSERPIASIAVPPNGFRFSTACFARSRSSVTGMAAGLRENVTSRRENDREGRTSHRLLRGESRVGSTSFATIEPEVSSQ